MTGPARAFEGPSLAGLVQIGRARVRTELVETDRWHEVRPRFATVYIENKCHLSCDHCYESDQSHPHKARLGVDDYARIFDELASLGVLYLTLTGGEIFLRGDLFELVALARQRRFAVRLYTSGTLLDEARADRIRDLKVSEVQVSVYSADPAVHDAFVGRPGAHAQTLQGMRLLRERGVITVLKTPAMTINIDSLHELADLAEAFDVDFRIDPLVHPRMDGHPHPLRYQVPPETLKKKLLAEPRLYEAFQQRSAESHCDGEGVRDASSTLCAAGRSVVSIGADGEVLPCASFPVAAGNVRERPLPEIWFRSALLDELRHTTFGDMTACRGCSLKASCDPCMAYALVENGDHRACNAASLNLATALRSLAQDRLRLDERMSRGRLLAIAGDHCAPAPEKRRGCGCGG
jgi:AdoMet-dependent heme synthase